MSWSKKIDKIITTDTYNNQKTKMDISEIKKLEQAIDVHGYRGQSKMKHNGVVKIKPNDKELWKSLKKYNKQEQKSIDKKISDEKLQYFCNVKVVAHCPNGNRGVGTLYKNDRGDLVLMMMGFANYNFQLF